MEIIFTEDYEVKDRHRTLHKRGSVLPCNDATGQHFIEKGVAEDYRGYRERLAAKTAAAEAKSTPPPAPDTGSAAAAPQKGKSATATGKRASKRAAAGDGTGEKAGDSGSDKKGQLPFADEADAPGK